MTDSPARRAIVLAAGQGKRMRGALPKVLHELCGRTMLDHVIAALRAAGVAEIAVVVSPALRERPEIADLAGVRLAVQARARGTGDAVRAALEALSPGAGPVAIVNGDMPLLDADLCGEMYAALGAGAAMALGIARMGAESSFGRIVRAATGEVERIVEVRDATDAERALEEMNAGVYAFDEAALRATLPELRADNAQGEYYLTDALALLRARGGTVRAVPIADVERVLGVNDRVELGAARRALHARIARGHMRAGVTILDPATTYIDADCEIGLDAVIAPGTTIARGSRVGAGARIGPHARLENAVIGENARVVESVVCDAEVGPESRVGPYAHLRMHARLDADVRVGNFVEVKNARLERGVRAGHLSYLGDADVGRNVNVGAGTITCNYDGRRKHRTVVEEEAFVGSNSSLIAPVTVGARAVVGAGSVVTRDVPPRATVLGNPARVRATRGETSDATTETPSTAASSGSVG